MSGLDGAAITAEAKYYANITKSRKEICLNLHYNAVFLYPNGLEIQQFKVKVPEIKLYQLCLANISKEFSINDIK